MPYLQATEVAKLPILDILTRVEMSEAGPAEASAALGLTPEPVIRVKDALEMYWDLAKDKVIGKTDDQIRKWRNPRIKAFKNFCEVVGNNPIAEITMDDMLDFREWLMELINRGEVKISSANKDITHFCGTLRLVNKMKRLGLSLPFDGIPIEGNDTGQRPAFSTSWITDKILAAGALDGLPDECIDIVHIAINTGARPSEISGALTKHFDLDGPIPMLHILPEGRQLKNKHSKRTIPLHGIALDAARRVVARGGFPSYANKDRASDDINRFFRPYVSNAPSVRTASHQPGGV